MKANFTSAFLIAILFLIAPKARAADDLRATAFGTMNWNTSEAHWNRLLRERTSLSEIPLGKSDFVVSSPAIGLFRRQPVPEGSSRLRRITSLPFIHSLIPQRMERPPGGTGSYWSWHDCPYPWQTVAEFAGKPPGHTFNGAFRLAGGKTH